MSADGSAQIAETTLVNWHQITSAAENLDVGEAIERAYVFRGQEDAEWTLKPTLHRAVTKEGRVALPSAERLLRIEDHLTEEFQGIAANHLPAATMSTTSAKVDWWPIMRHYGVPTRLLDVTRSFFVAAYFAASRAPDKDGAIYAIHGHTMYRAMENAYGGPTPQPNNCDAACCSPDAKSVLVAYNRKTGLVDRMIAQQGMYMLCLNVAGNLEHILATEMPKIQDVSGITLRKFRIPAAQKPVIMRRLRSFNVTGSSLFPGLDGIGRAMDELVRNL